MTIDTLIDEGKRILKKQENYSEFIGFINGQDISTDRDVIYSNNYTKWFLKTNTFLSRSCDEKFLNIKFESLFNLDDQFMEIVELEKAISILETVKETNSVKVQEVNEVNNLLEDLATFIKQGSSIINKTGTLGVYNAERYIKWSEKVSRFLNQYCTDVKYIKIFEDIFSSSHSSINSHAFSKGIKILELIQEDKLVSGDKMLPVIEIVKKSKIEKIFISHATKDADYIKLFVELLNKLGIKDKFSIFCSSIDDYGIPNGKNIYEHIKEEFDNNVFVLFFLSNNYYRSAACLNEMGATWIKSNKYQSILLPNFEFGDMRGAIDTNSISFRINEVARLNHFKEELTKIFNLTFIGKKLEINL